MEEERKYLPVNHCVSIEFEAADILDEMLDYAESHPRFDASYVNSIKKQALKTRQISAAQYNSLLKTYYAFRMDKST
jgi:plasmid stability protein